MVGCTEVPEFSGHDLLLRPSLPWPLLPLPGGGELLAALGRLLVFGDLPRQGVNLSLAL